MARRCRRLAGLLCALALAPMAGGAAPAATPATTPASTKAAAPGAPVQVLVPSLESRGARPLELDGFWFTAPGEGRRPALVLLHGCGGPYDRQGRLASRMRHYAGLLREQGWHVLVLDSLTARGESELCTQRIGTRAVTMANRRLDALGALAWLAQREDVDADRLVLLGWSNGGSTVLSASNLTHDDVAAARPRPRALVAFYPGCDAELKRGYRPSAPLQLLVGLADDWTPAAPCVALADRATASAPIAIERYEGAYHGFDSTAPVTRRKDVPNGVHPGQGVHVGGNAAAEQASRARMLAFLNEQLR